MYLTKNLYKELTDKMSLRRLNKTGLFKKMEVDDELLVREIKLHRAVLDRALLDWFSPAPYIKGSINKWLDMNNPDFLEACERAVLEPEKVFKTFHVVRQILEKNSEEQWKRP